MSAATARLLGPAETGDERIVLHGISWRQYESFLTTLGDRPGIRLAYLEGALEIMSPGVLHEDVKTLVARLVELYALERDVFLEAYGSANFRKKAKKRGVEPDECWCVDGMLRTGRVGEEVQTRECNVPDIAFEVVVTNWKIDKLAIYAGLEVPEVWIWKDRKFLLFALRECGYVPIDRSGVLPDLDFTVLARFARAKSQTDAVRRFRAWLKRNP
jgi:Uma2 family endonuclease